LHGGLDAEKERRCNVGFAIGGSLVKLIAERDATLTKTLKVSQEGARRHVQQKKNTYAIEGLQNNWWPKFRPVSHLWAAHLAIWNPKYPSFPCTLDELPDFLATAEYLRCRAERRPLARQGEKTLLPIGTAWAIHPDVPLPFPRIVIGDPEIWHSNDGTSAK
jgi:hypothetical protein